MELLLSNSPNDPYRDEMHQFGRLAGRWATEIRVIPSNGLDVRRAEGEWEFAYALDGRAVIDVWHAPKRSEAEASTQEWGLCVRIWDPELQLWRFTFHGTAHGDVVQMFGREVDGEMVLEMAQDGDLIRWTFFDITDASFSWEARRSADGGRTWRVEQLVRARRVESTRSTFG